MDQKNAPGRPAQLVNSATPRNIIPLKRWGGKRIQLGGPAGDSVRPLTKLKDKRTKALVSHLRDTTLVA